MMFPEEASARDLHRELERRFDAATTVSTESAGIHWRCHVRRGLAACTIAGPSSAGLEYFTTFLLDSREVATGRTTSKDRTVEAVTDWLADRDVHQLYARYPFVDRNKRALSHLIDAINSAVPEVGHIARVGFDHEGQDRYVLRVATERRGCEIAFEGDSEYPDAKFSWNGTQRFALQVDAPGRLALLVRRWLCDEVPPSTLRSAYPWLEIGEAAES